MARHHVPVDRWMISVDHVGAQPSRVLLMQRNDPGIEVNLSLTSRQARELADALREHADAADAADALRGRAHP